jgi:hypothetical protein
MVRKRLLSVVLSAVAVVATTLTTAQPAQAQDAFCTGIRNAAWMSWHMYTWHNTFYGATHPDTAYWAQIYAINEDAVLDAC